MDITLALLFLLLVLIVLILVSPSFLSRTKRAEEKGLTPLYEEWCAVHRDTGTRGSVGRNMFLWRVSLYPEFIVFALFSQDLIPYRNIVKLEVKVFQSSKEVWLHHRQDQRDELITIKSRKADQMLAAFADAGIRSGPVAARAGKRS